MLIYRANKEGERGTIHTRTIESGFAAYNIVTSNLRNK